MPLFEYSCRACGKRFEALVQGDGKGRHAPRCPSCGAARLDKLFSSFAVAGGRGESDVFGGADSESSDASCGTCGDPRGPGSCSFDDD